jgi:hypothetical protein
VKADSAAAVPVLSEIERQFMVHYFSHLIPLRFFFTQYGVELLKLTIFIFES